MGWSRSRLARAMELPAGERRAAAGAVALLLLVAPALKVVPMKRVRRALALGRLLPSMEDATPPSRVGRMVEAAGSLVPGAGCLAQTLVGEALLARRGHRTTIHVGVRRDGPDLAAHAWLEVGGAVVVGEAGSDGYRPLWTSAGTP